MQSIYQYGSFVSHGPEGKDCQILYSLKIKHCEKMQHHSFIDALNHDLN